MEDQGEVMGYKDCIQIIKGKRTKRLRQDSPLALTMATSSSSIAEGGNGGGGGGSHNSGGLDLFTTSPTNSVEFTRSTEEEEDMANCLILLAQGGQTLKPPERVATTTNKAAGLYGYECKTCNRCFPSFQALGGHRASHKKLKAATHVEGKKPVWILGEEDRFESDSTTLSLQISSRVLSSNNKSKVHECSVCGADFTSGQALGGHMRRHRTVTTMVSSSPQSTQEPKKPRSILSLDLNLPAPETEHRGKVMVFSASSLIDCHY